MKQTFLVTGAFGCIGAWVIRNLVREGTRVVAADLATEPVRPRLVMSDAELAQAEIVRLDVTDLAAVESLVRQAGITHIVHLAGLQTPGCKANPPLGARVNVVGTVNVLEAARRTEGQVQGLAYASSVAVFGREEYYDELPLRDDSRHHPETLYGAWKVANEHTARMYWEDWQVGSVGLRPFIVFGVGRDLGLTSDLAKAILAAAADRPFTIKFGKMVAAQYVNDVARIFIAAARSGYKGAAACNLRNDVLAVEEFVELIKQQAPGAPIGFDPERSLPFPADIDDSRLQAILGNVPRTPLPVAIGETLAMFRGLVARAQIDLRQLEE